MNTYLAFGNNTVIESSHGPRWNLYHMIEKQLISNVQFLRWKSSDENDKPFIDIIFIT